MITEHAAGHLTNKLNFCSIFENAKVCNPQSNLKIKTLLHIRSKIRESSSFKKIPISAAIASKCDAIKMTVQNLYKVSTPVNQSPGESTLSPLTPMMSVGAFNYNQGPGGFLMPPSTAGTSVERTSFTPQQRTVFPTMGKCGRLEYNSINPPPVFTSSSKPGTPLNSGEQQPGNGQLKVISPEKIHHHSYRLKNKDEMQW